MSETSLLSNRYEVQTRLGSGGMANVYRAYDHMLERIVAIKVLREDYSKDPAFRERFHQEAKAAANLSHPNIVTVHDFGLDSERLFIVMEYVPGIDLKTLIQQRGRIPVDEALPLMTQACAGIGYAHRAGLVHCDVKPQNIMVTPDQRVKVADFGIARALSSITPDEKAEVVWGSPQYFSPEQAAGNAPSPSSDVYSLGVVLFEMLTGRLPFNANSAGELALLHRRGTPPSPRQFNSSISQPLEQIILKVLSKEPSARYRTADQLGRVLGSLNRPAPVASELAAPSAPQEMPPLRRPATSPPPPAAPTQLSRPSAAPTQVSHPAAQPTAPAPAPALVYPITAPPQSEPSEEEAENPLEIDIVTWILGLLAFLLVGGLLPFWVWVYLVWNPPMR
jgi:serine/threonine-protein kinase